MERFFITTAAALLILAADGTGEVAAGSLPPGLKNAALEYIAAMQVEEYVKRDSTLANPAGIIPMATFDRETHGCHETPGQAYRVFKDHIGFRSGPGGRYTGKVQFTVFYRQASTVAEVFMESWQDGGSGILELTMEPLSGGWEVTGSREVIQ